MLFFSKPSPYLVDLIPDNHVDIHSHVLAGLDDGAPSLSHSIALIKAMQNHGMQTFIATPHVMDSVWENTSNTIQNAHKELEAKLNQNQINVNIRAAAEYMIDDRFAALIKTERLLTLKDNYVLVEMSYINAPLALYSILFDLQVAGYIPVLAHPERYLFYYNQWSEFEKLKRAGCLFQLNCNSVTGYYGTKVAEIAQKLLQKEMYDFIGSDVHHVKHIAAMQQKIVVKKALSELNRIIKNNDFFR